MRRTRPWLLLGATLCATAVTLVAPPALADPHRVIRHAAVGPASAAAFVRPASHQFDQTTLDTHFLKVTSSTGVPLYLALFVDQYGNGKSSGANLEVSVADRVGEQHLWVIDVTNRTFIFDPLTGEGTIRTGPQQIAPLGRVKLDVSPAGPETTTQCASGGTRAIRPVAVSGTVYFDTRSTAWGSVGDSVNRLTFGAKSTAESDSGRVSSRCQGYISRCRGGLSVEQSGRPGYLEAYTFARRGHRGGQLFYDHEAALPARLSGWRDDLATPEVAPFRLKHSGGKKVSVTLTAGDAGLVTGSATWTSTSPPAVRHNRCLGGTTKVWPSNYINGPDPLTFHFAFGGTHSFTDARGGTDIALDSVGTQHK